MKHSEPFLFQQLFQKTCSAYTYIVADAKTLDGFIIDPLLDTVKRDLKLIQELGIKLRYIFDTHVHADHVTGSGALADATGAFIAMNAAAGVNVDLPLCDGQTLDCGSLVVTALATPGHTDSCMSYYLPDMVFTGDTLLVRGNGRTDFQGGSSATLFESIMQKLYTLPDNTRVFAAHDYAGFTSSSIRMEKKFNTRITANTTKEQFIRTMTSLHLELPKKIALAVPANLRCGRPD